MSKKLVDILEIKKGVTAVIGGGGKTTLIDRLAHELSALGTVIICTTTKIYPIGGIPLVDTDNSDTLGEIVNLFNAGERIVCTGTWADQNKSSTCTNKNELGHNKHNNKKLSAPNVSINELAHIADYVLVEADGAKRLPLKAHAEYEPVIPACANKTIYVMGVDGIGKKISETCHRPELYAKIAGVNLDEYITPKIAVKVIVSEGYGDTLFINKVESKEGFKMAENIASEYRCTKNWTANSCVIAGSLREEEYKCLQ